MIKNRSHYLEDAIKFLIRFSKSRCHSRNADSHDEMVEIESNSQFSENEISTKDNDCMYNSYDTQNVQDEQEESSQRFMKENF